MSECTDVEPRLDAFVDSELSAAEQVDVARHLARCPKCNAIVDEVLALRDGLVTLTRTAVEAMSVASVWPAVAARTSARPASMGRPRRGSLRAAPMWVAGFAMAAGVVLMVRSASGPSVPPTIRVAERSAPPAVIDRVVGNVDVRHDRKNGAPIILVNYAGRGASR